MRNCKLTGWVAVLAVMFTMQQWTVAQTTSGDDPIVPATATPEAAAQLPAPDEPPAALPARSVDDAPVLTAPLVVARGPLHQALARPLNFNPGLVVFKEPPRRLDEWPAADAPPASNAVWVPGYWAWDDASRDFLWVSGLWRVPPQGFHWVPGYWTQGRGSYQWVSGFWTNRGEIEYIKNAPKQADLPPAAMPASWEVGAGSMIWTPAQYVWSPNGYIHVPGYWDYPLSQRGVAFAPVALPQPVEANLCLAYTPAHKINLSALTEHLFVRPRYQHYYFGDFYDEANLNLGIAPWFAFHPGSISYDPLFAQYRVQQTADWETTLRDQYVLRVADRTLRPATTVLVADGTAPGRVIWTTSVQTAVVEPEENVAGDIDPTERNRLRLLALEMEKFALTRLFWEKKAATSGRHGSHLTLPIPNWQALSYAVGPARAYPQMPLTAEQPVESYSR